MMESQSQTKVLGLVFGGVLKPKPLYWVAVKKLKLSYYIGETLLFTIYIYTYYGNLI